MASCSFCGRTLKDPKSIEAGIGPICRANKDTFVVQDDANMPYDGGDIILKRDPLGGIITNVPHAWVYHSPAGFEWGYLGSGPAELALNILLLFVPRNIAWRCHQSFKEDFIACMPFEGGVIKREDIVIWLKGKKVL